LPIVTLAIGSVEQNLAFQEEVLDSSPPPIVSFSENRM
jgi:hypothetical protein